MKYNVSHFPLLQAAHASSKEAQAGPSKRDRHDEKDAGPVRQRARTIARLGAVAGRRSSEKVWKSVVCSEFAHLQLNAGATVPVNYRLN